MPARPTNYLGWTDGSVQKVVQPPASACLQGWTAGQAPPYQWANWQIWLIDQWIQYLDQARSGGASNSSNSNARLLAGGNWSWNGVTNSLSWSAPFNVAVPSIADANNQAAAGGVTIADGSVAYVNLNVPFSYSGSTTSGSTSLTSMSSTQGVLVGMSVSGNGIPSGTTVTAVASTSVTMSAAATTTAGAQTFTFLSTGALSVLTAVEASLTVGPQTCIIARNAGGLAIVGVGAGEMLMRHLETKTLRGVGYGPLVSVTAGEAITALQAVYISPGSAGYDLDAGVGRTLGRAYLTDTSAAAPKARWQFAGIAITSASAGSAVSVVRSGIVNGFSSLVPGGTVNLSVTTSGGLDTSPATTLNSLPNTRTNISDKALVQIGTVLSDTQILVHSSAVNTALSTTPIFTSVTADATGQSADTPITAFKLLPGPQNVRQNVQRFVAGAFPLTASSFSNWPPQILVSQDRAYLYSGTSSNTSAEFSYLLTLNLPPSGVLNSVSVVLASSKADSFTYLSLAGWDDTTNAQPFSGVATQPTTAAGAAKKTVTLTLTSPATLTPTTMAYLQFSKMNTTNGAADYFIVYSVVAYVSQVNHALTWMRT